MVPADVQVLELFGRGGITSDVRNPFVLIPDRHGVPRTHIAHDRAGTCVFRHDQRCAVHAETGEQALPVACRHYPRVVLRDARGTMVSLSHYCPTAASLLRTAGPARIVDGARLAPAEPVEGLDAQGALPPLVRPGLLADLEGYGEWERAVVDTFARIDQPCHALSRVAGATELVRGWTPADGPLSTAVRDAFAHAALSDIHVGWDTHAGVSIVRSLHGDLPSSVGEKLIHISAIDGTQAAMLSNYLAARAFANWVAYQGRGLRTIVAWLYACLHVADGFARESGAAADPIFDAVRSTDLVMLHTIDSHDFARAAMDIESA
jgi:hypothetical protein